jgi:guanine deaminase
MMEDKQTHFMEMAVKLSAEGMNKGVGGPFGCVIVKDGEIVGRGSNSVSSTNDPTAHAEVVAIRDACKNLDTFQLTGCEVYTSCEPCPMCLGAIYWARPDIVYYANTQKDAAEIGFDDQFIYEEIEKNPEDRKIKFQQLKLKEAKSVFIQWKDKGNKILY